MTEMKVIKDVESFNRLSKTYDQSWMQHLYFDRIHKRVLACVDAGFTPVSIVDVGCGTGRLLRKARERWPHANLTGVDPAEGMVKKARILIRTQYLSSARQNRYLFRMLRWISCLVHHRFTIGRPGTGDP